MITRMSIENFKGIRERVQLDFRPITLLFGANSAGKSTIVQALHCAREIFERNNLNPDRTISGGEFVDLGGFQNFVHGHEKHRTIKLGFEVNLKGWDNLWYVPMYSLERSDSNAKFLRGVLHNRVSLIENDCLVFIILKSKILKLFSREALVVVVSIDLTRMALT